MKYLQVYCKNSAIFLKMCIVYTTMFSFREQRIIRKLLVQSRARLARQHIQLHSESDTGSVSQHFLVYFELFV